jgi:Outer membrane protein beta-barrel domain
MHTQTNKMKKTIVLMVVTVFCSMLSQAQKNTSSSGSVSFGLRGGINFQNISGKDVNGNKLSSDMLTGYNFGINAEFPLAPQFYFQPGLLFSQKGAKNLQPTPGETAFSTIKISYVELPLNLVFKPALGQGHMLLGFGPYVALGVAGNANVGSGQDMDIKFQNTVADSDPNNVVYIRPVDAGANMLAGYEFRNKVSFQLNVQLGLVKINADYDKIANDETIAKNTGFGLSLGYRF